MNPRIRSVALTALGVTVLGGLAAAVSPLLQTERVLKDNQLKKVTSTLGSWLEAVDQDGDSTKAEEKFREELDKLNERTLKGGDLLAHPADLGFVLYEANDYAKKEKGIKKTIGKVSTQTFDRGPMKIEYAVWTPDGYKSKDGPYPLVITLPEEGESPEAHITNHWATTEAAKTSVIACPKMPGNGDAWLEPAGIGPVMLTMGNIQTQWAIDSEKVFIGGRGLGGEVALEITNMFPKQFTGAFAWASDAGAGIEPLNLKHVPVLIAGGGSKATDFEKRAADAKVEGVTLDAGADANAIAAWMSDKTRANYPTDVTVIPGERFPTSGYWLSFDPVPAGSGARVDGTYDRETNTITLTGKNVTAVTLYLSDAMVDLSKPVKVVANGVESVDMFDRSLNHFLGFIKSAKVDPARVFVAAKLYNLPALEDGEGSDG